MRAPVICRQGKEVGLGFPEAPAQMIAPEAPELTQRVANLESEICGAAPLDQNGKSELAGSDVDAA